MDGPPVGLVRRLQRILLALSALTTIGAALELASLRHWDGVEQLVPWLALAVLGAAIVAVAVTPRAVRTARLVGALAAASGLYGAWVHVLRNHDAGPLDFRYQATWATMSAASRWWKAATGGVGPSPALAPAILALAGACLALSTVGMADGRRRVRTAPRSSCTP